ncbi:MAG TPA: SRPBCC family protein [Caulobacteraceae bacterium]|jgi:uncharacterized protein YndB with AHSA1/START domain|nr:SRPBCC family protein [Caulobacteraceae bacterium]
MSESMIRPAPVTKSVLVKTTPEHAFETFTANMGRWWPKTHSTASSPQKQVVMEPRDGGRWYEIGEDGGETEWGRVLAWDPPARLLLAWQLTGEWKYDADFVTEVEVKFVPEGDAIRVTLEHRNLERYGEKADVTRAALDSEGGWTGMMALYKAAAEAS